MDKPSDAIRAEAVELSVAWALSGAPPAALIDAIAKFGARAEARGAERMREAAAKIFEPTKHLTDDWLRAWHVRLAAAIRALPLPAEEPQTTEPSQATGGK